MPRPPKLIRAVNRFLDGKLGLDQLELVYKDVTASLFRKLMALGVTEFNDGMFRWDDLFTPIVLSSDNVDADGLFRFFDNNFYYRAPVVKGPLEPPLRIVEWYRIALEIVKYHGFTISVRPAVCGPLTFVLHAIDKHYGSVSTLLEAYAKCLGEAMEELGRLGARVVEIHDPSITNRRTPIELAGAGVRALEELAQTSSVRLWVHTYFRSDVEHMRMLLESSVPIVGVDVVENDPLGLREESEGREIALGIVDSRNTRRERLKELCNLVTTFLDGGAKVTYITPNAMLDFLPEKVAYRKLRVLVSVSRRLGG